MQLMYVKFIAAEMVALIPHPLPASPLPPDLARALGICYTACLWNEYYHKNCSCEYVQ